MVGTKDILLEQLCRDTSIKIQSTEPLGVRNDAHHDCSSSSLLAIRIKKVSILIQLSMLMINSII